MKRCSKHFVVILESRELSRRIIAHSHGVKELGVVKERYFAWIMMHANDRERYIMSDEHR